MNVIPCVLSLSADPATGKEEVAKSARALGAAKPKRLPAACTCLPRSVGAFAEMDPLFLKKYSHTHPKATLPLQLELKSLEGKQEFPVDPSLCRDTHSLPTRRRSKAAVWGRLRGVGRWKEGRGGSALPA